MAKGSPEEYNADTGLAGPGQKLQTGEPNERTASLYRIRCPQENHLLLREANRRHHCRRRQTGSQALDVAAVGQQTLDAVAWGHGSNVVQRLDLRHVETVRGQAGNGSPGADESYRCIEEKERQAGRTHDLRPIAMQPAAYLLGGADGNPGAATDAALPKSGGGTGRADEEQDRRPADGERGGIQQETAARSQVLRRADGESGRSTRVGEEAAEAEPRIPGGVPGDAAAVVSTTADASAVGRAGGAVEEHSGSGRCGGANVGAGN